MVVPHRAPGRNNSFKLSSLSNRCRVLKLEGLCCPTAAHEKQTHHHSFSTHSSFRLPHIRSLKGGTQDGERLLLLLLLHLSSERRSHLDCNHESINHRFEPYPGYPAASTTPFSFHTLYCVRPLDLREESFLCGASFFRKRSKKYPVRKKVSGRGRKGRRHRRGTSETETEICHCHTAVPHGARTS